MFYEVLTWKQAMDRMLEGVQNMDARCPLCYKTYVLGEVEQLATHMKRCYMSRSLEQHIDTHGYSGKSTEERLAMLQDVGERVNYEITRYLIDHADFLIDPC